jgi:transposase
MDYHYHARLTIVRREQLAKGVLEGQLSLKEAMAEFKLSRQTTAKWVRRYREQGMAGLRDRTSRPHRSPRRTSEERIMEVERLRRERWTGVRIAQQLGLSRATVSRVLRRLGLNRIRGLEPATAVVRYEHAAPGDDLPPIPHPVITGVSRFRFGFEIISQPPSRLCRCGKHSLLSTSA